MSNKIEIFNNPSFGNIRVQKDEDGEPLFCLADVCRALEISDPSNVSRQVMTEFELPVLKTGCFDTGFGIKELNLITEQQLYFVMNRSDKPNAKPFRMWVNTVVLPSIRKTGSYSVTKSPFDVIAQDMDPLARLDAMKEIILQQRKLQEAAVAKEKEKTMIVHSALSNVKDQYVTLDKRYRNTMDIIQEFSKGVCGASVTDAAKAISSHNKFGIKVSGKQLMEFLRAKELILKNNTPSQKAIDEGVLVAEFIVITNGNKRWPKLLTKITSKGLVYVTDLLLKEVLKQEDEQFSLF